jgi:D-alanyl-D-alanine carboxypeptidase
VLAVMAPAAGCGRGGTAAGTPAPNAGAPAPTGVAPSRSPTAVPSPTSTARPSATPSPRFTAQISRVSRDTLKYSWHPGCPVPVSGLRLIKMTYWGMDHKPHNGQLVVNAAAAGDVVSVFTKLYAGHYPIRRMELVDLYKGSDFDSIEADNTSAFNCRNATGSSSWSQHAYGLAIDINTCENPYVHASGKIEHKKCVTFGDRSRHDPGVIHNHDLVVRSFRSIGWGWGGLWSGAKDYQHFSSNGR